MPAPIRPGSAVVSPTATPTPSSPAAEAPPAPRVPDAFTESGPAPAGAAGTVDLASMLGQAAPDPYALIPGRFPDAVSLPDALAAFGASPERKAAVAQLLDGFQQKTGVRVPDAVRDAVLLNPSLLTRALPVTMQALKAGIDAVNLAYRSGQLPQVEPRQHRLPRHFDFADLASLSIPRPEATMKQIAPGLYQGDLPSPLSDAEVKQNLVMAEVLDRLAGNAGLPEAERFRVTYGGRTFTRLDNFLDALREAGHEVTVTFEQRIANFANLKTKVPGSDAWLDVPAPLMVKTGVTSPEGREAVVPASHAEMIIRIRRGPEAQGSGIDAEVRYFQGVTQTGFFAGGTFAEPRWLGRVRHGEPLEGARALEAVKLAGLFTDVVRDAARSLNLYAEGYGITGVCNDSVAIVQQAITGSTQMYPLFMRDDILLPELTRRLEDRDRRDDPAYRRLADAVRALPSDFERGPTTAERARSSLPWEPGHEPFFSTVEARRILGGG